ncbi:MULTISPECIES: serine hydrolase [unclassified Streptococcus]|uniref:serine hydrolase n=1 Tax=unclassified Streptococcus TaxID=2608887 RepID=UPI0010727C3C|nr:MULTISPECIES: serine hydrolase [unclassified Streptococcus]MBF0786990.1 serine hydrolase [Streptococcus sp. 19428wC2_LYSM12]MCQ9211534.1 class A beta-lactamase-related serine hydrolase [Streptococcus sp. B01]MCQ9214850.1 class A beta-lactamase-related serine hydrolase [Streptococcus sp. O1]TFV06189.1 serine hydrolase [Streptococcus sp. LYSM12]
MKKQLIWLISPILFAAAPVGSTEIPFELSNQMNYQLNYKEYSTDFQTIPSNPNVYEEVDTYLDKELTIPFRKIKPNSPFSIIGVDVNSQNQLVFQLQDKRYVVADQTRIYDDIIVAHRVVSEKAWLKKNVTLYSSPIANQAKKLSLDSKPYQEVTVSEIVETHLGFFAKINSKAWVHLNDLSRSDNRIEAVQDLLTTKYSSKNIAVYVKKLSTGETAGVNQEKMMYAASVAKLPTLYYVQENINRKKINLTDSVKYVKETEDFDGAYEPEGSGSIDKIPDNQKYRIDDLIDRTAKESDNVASNLLGYYAADKFDKRFYQETTRIAGQKWDMVSRMASAEMAGLMMEAIYRQNGYVLESLSATNFDDQRIARDIDVKVAHKIGDAYDFKHDVAIVYAKEPFVLSIFTDQMTYDDISQIANDVYGILK